MGALVQINVGAAINDKTGDPLRTAYQKVNDAFTALDTRAPYNLTGLLAADSGSHNYRVAVMADISFAGLANGLATLDNSGKVPLTQLYTATANGLATLDSAGKLLAAQLPPSVVGALNYQTTWNASTNTPALASGVGTKGYYYVVGTAGSTAIDGVSQWNVGDWIVYDGTKWDKVDGTPNEVTSVAGRTGAVVLTIGDISGALAAANNLSELTNKQTAQTNLGVRKVLTAATTYHVSTTGSDTINDGTATYPWATIQHALNYIWQSLDVAGKFVTIQLAAGTYAGASVTMPNTGGGVVTIQGDTVAPSSYIIDGGTSQAVIASNGSYLELSGLQLESSNAAGLSAVESEYGAVVDISGNCYFGSTPNGAHMYAHDGGNITIDANYTISGGASLHWSTANGGQIRCTGRTVNISAAVSIPYFAQAIVLSCMYVTGMTFTNKTNVTGTQYFIGENSTVYTAGAGSAYLPGGTAGIASSGGQYA